MNFETFTNSLSDKTPPAELNEYLQALWFDGKGNWDKAHHLIQDIEDKTAAWIHAYLHRKEGDDWNANYWYNLAGKKMPSEELETEWENIVKALL